MAPRWTTVLLNWVFVSVGMISCFIPHTQACTHTILHRYVQLSSDQQKHTDDSAVVVVCRWWTRINTEIWLTIVGCWENNHLMQNVKKVNEFLWGNIKIKMYKTNTVFSLLEVMKIMEKYEFLTVYLDNKMNFKYTLDCREQ